MKNSIALLAFALIMTSSALFAGNSLYGGVGHTSSRYPNQISDNSDARYYEKQSSNQYEVQQSDNDND